MSVSVNPPGNSLPQELNSKPPFLNIKLYVLIAIALACTALLCFFIFLCFCFAKNSRKRKLRVKNSSGSIPLVSKEIVEIKDLGLKENCEKQECKMGKEVEVVTVVNVDEVGDNKIKRKKKKKKSDEEEEKESDDVSGKSSEVSGNIGWGRWYSLRELELATRGFAVENVIGEGGYGIVYRGVLHDGSVVAVKNLLNNKYV